MGAGLIGGWPAMDLQIHVNTVLYCTDYMLWRAEVRVPADAAAAAAIELYCLSPGNNMAGWSYTVNTDTDSTNEAGAPIWQSRKQTRKH